MTAGKYSKIANLHGIADTRALVVLMCIMVIIWNLVTTEKWIEEEYLRETESIRREHTNLAKAFSEHVRRTVAGLDEIMVMIKAEYERDGLTNDAILLHLQEAKHNPVLNGGQLSIIDESGNYVISSILQLEYPNAADRNYFQVHFSDAPKGLYISEPLWSRVTGKQSIYLSRRINKSDGSFGGVVAAALAPQYFDQFYRQMELRPSQNITLIGLDGIVRVSYFLGQNAVGKNLSYSRLFSSVQSSTEGMIEGRGILTGEPNMQYFRVMPDYPFVVSVGIAKSDAFREFNFRKQHQYNNMLLYDFIVIVLGAGLVLQLNRQNKARKASDLQKAQLASMLDNIPHMAWLKDQQGRYIAVNQPYLDTLRLARETIIGKTDQELWPQEIADSYQEQDREVIKTKQRKCITGKALNRPGSFWEESYKSPVFGLSGELLGTTGIALDITERKLREEEIHRMAFFDNLTGLPNRSYLIEKLESELEKCRNGETSGAVLFIDLDDFKTVNDTLGHIYGDQVIKKAGEQILAAAQGGTVARIGGDEFIVLLSGQDNKQDVSDTAARIVKAVASIYYIGDLRVHLSASVGIASYPGNGTTVEDIFKNADVALYAAKSSGRNTWYFYDANLQNYTQENMLLKLSLRGALERGEMFLLYQPVLSAKFQNVISFEALIRWRNDQFGLVLPSRFIPLAEESDIILLIGIWVLKEACGFARVLAEMGRSDIRIAVNVSPRQLQDENFVGMVEKTILDSGVLPMQICIEITENLFIKSIDDSVLKLEKLRAFGVNLSLDDFGTGYSSLIYLRKLPIDLLKIDKAFIDKLTNDEAQQKFLISLINMAHTLQLTVVAEGVETEQQLMKLLDCNCDAVQGNHFSVPVPAEVAIRLISG